MPAGRLLWKITTVLAIAVAVYFVAFFGRGRSTYQPAAPPDTSHASWRGYDSGYEHPSSRKSEDAHAPQR